MPRLDNKQQLQFYIKMMLAKAIIYNTDNSDVNDSTNEEGA
jgi:hypothetical protein